VENDNEEAKEEVIVDSEWVETKKKLEEILEKEKQKRLSKFEKNNYQEPDEPDQETKETEEVVGDTEEELEGDPYTNHFDIQLPKEILNQKKRIHRASRNPSSTWSRMVRYPENVALTKTYFAILQGNAVITSTLLQNDFIRSKTDSLNLGLNTTRRRRRRRKKTQYKRRQKIPNHAIMHSK